MHGNFETVYVVFSVRICLVEMNQATNQAIKDDPAPGILR